MEATGGGAGGSDRNALLTGEIRLWQSFIFPYRVGLGCGECLKYVSSLPLLFVSCQSQEGIFLSIPSCEPENPVGLLEGKPRKVWGHHTTVATKNLCHRSESNSIARHLSKSPLTGSFTFMVPVASVRHVSRSQL